MPDQPREVDEFGALLWRTWGELGVSTWDRAGAGTVVDPEALIVLSEAHGDQRLRHETIDWGILHAHLLSPSRLRHLGRRAGVEPALGAWLATVAAHATAVRWRTDRADALSGYVPSRASRWYGDAPVDRPAAAALRLRAYTGTSVRAEVVRALHPVALGLAEAQSALQIAGRAGTTAPGVFAILSELEQSGLLRQIGTPRRRRYEPRIDHVIARDVWHPWQSLPYGPWLEALDAVPALLTLHRAMNSTELDPSEIAAKARTYDTARGTIEALTRETPAPRPRGNAATVDAELARIGRDALARALTLLNHGHAAPQQREPPGDAGTMLAGSPWAGID